MKKSLPKGTILLAVLLLILVSILAYKAINVYQLRVEEDAVYSRIHQNDRIYNYIKLGGSAFLKDIEFDGDNSKITLKQDFYKCIPVACNVYNADPNNSKNVNATDVFEAFEYHLNDLIDNNDGFNTVNSFVHWCGTYPSLIDKTSGQSVENAIFTNYAFANSRGIEPDWVYPWEYEPNNT